ncbi:uncharacterized protein BJX67DRAFT_381386 [Aspergillus lucknowensis]|uniref:Gfd2/YDR514C-like C-terminal domain-containing protein n=1 Tax=Aspergillus lucknowensis TaxID=176173 RepID=A0ABR4LRA3_9EURO
MSAADRLQILFAQDQAILQINTRLRPVVEHSEPPAAEHASKPLSESSVSRLNQPQIHVVEDKRTPAVAFQGPNATPSPHDGTFCPFSAVSRFPYHHIRGDLMHRVASKYFDKGQFWDRTWDLYYIRAPPRLGGRPLVLVPTEQVRLLFREINTALDCSLSLPVEEEKGLMLRFNRDGFPQPTFLGKSNSKETKDSLESTIRQACTFKPSSGIMDESFMAFEKMMEAAIAAAKSKSKSKAKKQRLRIQRELEASDAARRAQCYLGLRADPTDLIEGKWDEHQTADPHPPRLAVDKPVPHPFWTEPVFVSVDVEVNERCHTLVTEVGISTLDTRDLIGVAPGPQGEGWQSRIRSRHLRVEEYANHVNRLYVRGCPDKFEFGVSEWVSADEVSSTVQSSFAHPTFFDGDEKKLRPLVLVGHSLISDIQYLELAGVHIVEKSSGASNFADRIDTATTFQVIRGETAARSLGAVLGELGMTGWNLHNAGNDARYTMQALVAMLVKHSIPSSGMSQ